MSGWSWFDRRAAARAPQTGDPAAADAVAAAEARLDAAYRATFATPEGRRVLAHLRAVTLERVVSPEPGNGCALRHLEGQRHLVLAIERRLRAPPAARPGQTEEDPA